MKFDILNWKEVEPNEEQKAPKGRLCLRSSQSAAFYVSCEGYEVLAGTGQEIDITFKEEMTYRVEAPKGTRVFCYAPNRLVHTTEAEEVFTNIDRQPMESGNLLEVKKAMRQFKLMQYQAEQETRQAHKAQIARLRAERPKPDTETEVEEKPEVVKEAEEKPQGE